MHSTATAAAAVHARFSPPRAGNLNESQRTGLRCVICPHRTIFFPVATDAQQIYKIIHNPQRIKYHNLTSDFEKRIDDGKIFSATYTSSQQLFISVRVVCRDCCGVGTQRKRQTKRGRGREREREILSSSSSSSPHTARNKTHNGNATNIITRTRPGTRWQRILWNSSNILISIISIIIISSSSKQE